MAVRDSFNGSNVGNTLGDIVLLNYGLTWQLPLKQKVDVHGHKRQQVGGKVEGEEDVGRGARLKAPQTVEPVALWVKLAMCPSGRPCLFRPNLWHMLQNAGIRRLISSGTVVGALSDGGGSPEL